MQIQAQNIQKLSGDKTSQGKAGAETGIESGESFGNVLKGKIQESNGKLLAQAKLGKLQNQSKNLQNKLANLGLLNQEGKVKKVIHVGANAPTQNAASIKGKGGKEEVSSLFLSKDKLNQRGELLANGVKEEDALEIVKGNKTLAQVVATEQPGSRTVRWFNQQQALKANKANKASVTAIGNALSQKERLTKNTINQMAFNQMNNPQSSIDVGQILAQAKKSQSSQAAKAGNKADLASLIQARNNKQNKLQEILGNSKQQEGLEALKGMINPGQMNSISDINQLEPDVKVFDLGKVEGNSVTQIMAKVSDYIIQNHVNARPRLELNFHHEALGNINLMVEKNGGNIDLNIATSTLAGKEFFSNHRGELLGQLAGSGISIGDFKLESKSNLAESRTGDQSGQGFGQDRHDSHSQRRDSERRRELWEDYQQRNAS